MTHKPSGFIIPIFHHFGSKNNPLRVDGRKPRRSKKPEKSRGIEQGRSQWWRDHGSCRYPDGLNWLPEFGTAFNLVTNLLNPDFRINIRHSATRLFQRVRRHGLTGACCTLTPVFSPSTGGRRETMKWRPAGGYRLRSGTAPSRSLTKAQTSMLILTIYFCTAHLWSSEWACVVRDIPDNRCQQNKALESATQIPAMFRCTLLISGMSF